MLLKIFMCYLLIGIISVYYYSRKTVVNNLENLLKKEDYQKFVKEMKKGFLSQIKFEVYIFLQYLFQVFTSSAFLSILIWPLVVLGGTMYVNDYETRQEVDEEIIRNHK